MSWELVRRLERQVSSLEDEASNLRDEITSLQQTKRALERDAITANTAAHEAWKAHQEALTLIATARREAQAWKLAAEKTRDETQKVLAFALHGAGFLQAAEFVRWWRP